MNIQYRKIEIEQAKYSNKQIDKRSFPVEYHQYVTDYLS